MSRRDLSRLLRPRSVAVIGGGTWCANVVEACRKIGFSGDIWPVHPTREAVAGARAFASIDDLPSAPDASFVGINRTATIPAIKSLSDMGGGGAICFASGFGEAVAEIAGAADLEAQLVKAAGDMPVIGPNCYGLLNYLDNVAIWPDQHGGVPVETGVAIVTQSSNIAINLTMQRRGLPLAYVVTAGNQAQTGWAEIGLALLQDDRVTALGLHIEGVGDLRAFEALAAQAHALGKPIVALRVGRSVEAQAALVSHTASLAGSDAGARALMARLGVGEVFDLSTFLETLKLLHTTGPLSSNRIVSLSCSGGEASLVADAAVGWDVAFPPLTDAQKTELRATLGPDVALANPLDYQTYIWGDVARLGQTFSAALAGDVALGMVVLDFPRADRCDPAAWMPVIDAAVWAKEQAGKPLAIVSSLVDTLPEVVAEDCQTQGLVPFNGLPEALAAIEVAARLKDHRPAAPLLLPKTGEAGRGLSEAHAKTVLARYGLQVPKAKEFGTADAAVEALSDFGSLVAMKAVGLAHKTEAGGVALNLTSEAAVRQAFATMPTDTVLVEQMITGGLVEMLIGVTCDPAHGYVLTLGAGGTLTEIMGDTVSLLVPASEVDIRAAMSRLRIAPLLAGYRGAPPVDHAALVAAIMGVQAYVTEARPIEVEINPLICTADGAFVADALITLGDDDD